MPHCIVEHSTSIDGNTLMASVFQGALRSKLFEVDGRDIKVRALPYSHFQTGNGKLDFVHVTLKILSGRNAEQKLCLSDAVLESLKTLELTSVSITVEVVDIDRDSYAKIVI